MIWLIQTGNVFPRYKAKEVRIMTHQILCGGTEKVAVLATMKRQKIHKIPVLTYL